MTRWSADCSIAGISPRHARTTTEQPRPTPPAAREGGAHLQERGQDPVRIAARLVHDPTLWSMNRPGTTPKTRGERRATTEPQRLGQAAPPERCGTTRKRERPALSRAFSMLCGAEGNRTPDLLDANETRYQLRYSPSPEVQALRLRCAGSLASPAPGPCGTPLFAGITRPLPSGRAPRRARRARRRPGLHRRSRRGRRGRRDGCRLRGPGRGRDPACGPRRPRPRSPR